MTIDIGLLGLLAETLKNEKYGTDLNELCAAHPELDREATRARLEEYDREDLLVTEGGAFTSGWEDSRAIRDLTLKARSLLRDG